MRLKKTVNRVGIFFFYDKDGVADDYIIYYLENINQYFTEILVVCNGKLTADSRRKLEKLNRVSVIVRENKGFDVWAYKTGIEYYGWECLEKIDELIMFNFTIMGPVGSFEEMFTSMSEKDLDFWGLTIHNGAPFDPWDLLPDKKIPIHIQSHFIAVRKKMLSSFEFREYWKAMPMITRYEEAVGLHEAIFTSTFENFGYRWDVYVDTADLVKETFYPMFNMPVELIRDRKCPFFKRKIFIYEWESSTLENDYSAGAELFRYLKEETAYDTSMIIKHLMRTGHLSDFISATNSRIVGEEIEPFKIDFKVAVIVTIKEEQQFYYFADYLNNIPEAIPIYLVVGGKTNKEAIKNKFHRAVYLIENREEVGEDSWLSLGDSIISQYKYICRISDIAGDYMEPITNIRAYARMSYSSMLYSLPYLYGVIRHFEENPDLGMMIPPLPIHSGYYGIQGHEWGSKKNYDSVAEALEQLGCKIPLSYEKKAVVSLSGCFWIRTEAILGLLNKEKKKILKELEDKNKDISHIKEDIPDFIKTLCQGSKYIFCYYLQSQGYYTAYLTSKKEASNLMTNYDALVARTNHDFHNYETQNQMIYDVGANFDTAQMNYDCGKGYYSENLVSQMIIYPKYSKEAIYLLFPVLKDSKELVLNLCYGKMTICSNIKFYFKDQEGHFSNIKIEVKSNCSAHMKNGIDIFFNQNAEYRLKGDFSNIKEVLIEIEQLASIPYINGINFLFKNKFLLKNCRRIYENKQ